MERSREEGRVADKKIHVFIVGSKGIPARYGGFETFAENLTAGKQTARIQYHVSCMNQEEKHFAYNQADCFNVKLPVKGAPGRILHVSRALSQVEEWKKKNRNENTVVYILGCRIGPLLLPHAKRMKKLGIMLCVNPDGLEWKRDKWNRAEKLFLMYCEACLIRCSDLVICDSHAIQRYIDSRYAGHSKPTRYIAYGADVNAKSAGEAEIDNWYRKHETGYKRYYLAVGRFVPENNLEFIIREFMKSNTDKSLLVIANIERNKFYRSLEKRTGFHTDGRIKMVGSVYNRKLLQEIREGAYGYIHGHEVGGTNPSLLEALASTELNLLLEVAFNQEVAQNGALYFKKSENSLKELIERADQMGREEITAMGQAAKQRILEEYSWEKIIAQYEKVWAESERREH